MTLILTAIVLFLTMIRWIIFIDVILSFLTIFGIKFRPDFIASIVDPLYAWVKSVIPTNIWPLDFTPIVILIIIHLFTLFIFWLDQDVVRQINNFSAIF